MSREEKYATIITSYGKVCGMVDLSLFRPVSKLDLSLRGTGYSLMPIYKYSDDVKSRILHKFIQSRHEEQKMSFEKFEEIMSQRIRELLQYGYITKEV